MGRVIHDASWFTHGFGGPLVQRLVVRWFVCGPEAPDACLDGRDVAGRLPARIIRVLPHVAVAHSSM